MQPNVFQFIENIGNRKRFGAFHIHVFERIAPPKHVVAYALHACRNVDFFEVNTFPKRAALYFSETFGQRDFCDQAFAEGIALNGGDAVGNAECPQTLDDCEAIRRYHLHFLGEMHGVQPAAAAEQGVAHLRNAVGKVDRRKRIAIHKRVVADTAYCGR